MYLNNELAKAIFGSDGSAKYKEYETAVRIKEEIQKRQTSIRRLLEERDDQIKVLEEEMKKMQAECKHQVTHYHPDPSGNSDSWTECVICGKSL